MTVERGLAKGRVCRGERGEREKGFSFIATFLEGLSLSLRHCRHASSRADDSDCNEQHSQLKR